MYELLVGFHGERNVKNSILFCLYIIIIFFLCISSISCAYYDGHLFIGIGKIELDEEGRVRKMECNSPVEINKL